MPKSKKSAKSEPVEESKDNGLFADETRLHHGPPRRRK
jgi:hypothetical protein